MLSSTRNQWQFGVAVFGTLVAITAGYAAPPPGYYDTAEGLAGPALKDALYEIIKNHTVIPYSSSSGFDTRDALETADEDPNDSLSVRPRYKASSMLKSSFGSSGQTAWNREHVWPQSLGADVSPQQSDLHHLFAEEAALNSSRSNSVFDDFSVNAPSGSTNTRDGNTWTGNQFDVRPESRGNIARAVLYMTVRYPRMKLTDSLTPAYNQMGRKAVLLKWHQEDPVDAEELSRNDQVYSFQGNRNPFIDHPEYASLIFAGVTNGDSVSVSISNVTVAGTVKIAMVSTRGSDGDAGKEFIVLANHTASAVSLTGWELRKQNGGYVLALSGTIPAYGHFLIASGSYSSAADIEGFSADQYVAGSGLLNGLSDSSATSIGLFDGSGSKVDGFSFNGSASGDTATPTLRDGTAFSSSPGSTGSIRRKRQSGDAGPYLDTDSNSSDLEIVATRTPMNSSITLAPLIVGFQNGVK